MTPKLIASRSQNEPGSSGLTGWYGSSSPSSTTLITHIVLQSVFIYLVRGEEEKLQIFVRSMKNSCLTSKRSLQIKAVHTPKKFINFHILPQTKLMSRLTGMLFIFSQHTSSVVSPWYICTTQAKPDLELTAA